MKERPSAFLVFHRVAGIFAFVAELFAVVAGFLAVVAGCCATFETLFRQNDLSFVLIETGPPLIIFGTADSFRHAMWMSAAVVFLHTLTHRVELMESTQIR